ncbi:MAG: hypothetical protein ACPG4X_15755 [Pikeienuella sp.]
MITPFVPYFAAASGGGLPSGLVAQWEMDNTTVTATSWIDEIGSLNMVSSGYADDPTITSGGTPSGMDLYDFGTSGSKGLGVDVTSSSLPSGNSNRTMAVVIGWKSGDPNYQGVMYGDNASKEAFGITAVPGGDPAVDFWASSVTGSTSMNGTGLHVLIARYDGTNAVLYVDGAQEGSSAVGPLNTTLDSLRAVHSLSGGAAHGVELAAILIWDNDVGASGVSDIQTYLNNKYLVA